MNAGPLLFLLTFFFMATSWVGFVLTPQLQVGRQNQVEVKETGQPYPVMRSGLARQGEQIYRQNGCFYCHTEQARPKGFGSDAERGWGGRPGVVQSVAQDYLYDRPVMIGTQRVGPDLANVGKRSAGENAVLSHIYNPQATMPKSVMPPYRYLFEKRTLKSGQKKSEDALEFIGKQESDVEVVPTDQARALAAYVMSLRSEAVLFETPPPPPAKTNAPTAATTNAPTAAPTNAPAGTNK